MIKKFIIGIAITILMIFGTTTNAYAAGQLYNAGFHAVVVHNINGTYSWIGQNAYAANIDRFRPDVGWQAAWHFSGEYIEHYTNCPRGTSAPYLYRCYSVTDWRDVVIDASYPL